MNISLQDETDDQGVHCVGAWPKGITVGNWREGNYVGYPSHTPLRSNCSVFPVVITVRRLRASQAWSVTMIG